VGADLLAPVAVGPQRLIGTAVDYAHYVYSLVSQTLNYGGGWFGVAATMFVTATKLRYVEPG